MALSHIAAQHLLRRPAVEPLGTLAPGRHNKPVIHRDDRILGVLQQASVVGELLFISLLLGYIVHHQ
jgi:hypothetical protein